MLVMFSEVNTIALVSVVLTQFCEIILVKLSLFCGLKNLSHSFYLILF